MKDWATSNARTIIIMIIELLWILCGWRVYTGYSFNRESDKRLNANNFFFFTRSYTFANYSSIRKILSLIIIVIFLIDFHHSNRKSSQQIGLRWFLFYQSINHYMEDFTIVTWFRNGQHRCDNKSNAPFSTPSYTNARKVRHTKLLLLSQLILSLLCFRVVVVVFFFFFMCNLFVYNVPIKCA